MITSETPDKTLIENFLKKHKRLVVKIPFTTGSERQECFETILSIMEHIKTKRFSSRVFLEP